MKNFKLSLMVLAVISACNAGAAGAVTVSEGYKQLINVSDRAVDDGIAGEGKSPRKTFYKDRHYVIPEGLEVGSYYATWAGYPGRDYRPHQVPVERLSTVYVAFAGICGENPGANQGGAGLRTACSGLHEAAIYSSLVDDKAFSKKKLNDQFSLVSSSNRISSDQLLKLLAGDPRKVSSCQALVVQKTPLDDLVVENLDNVKITIDKIVSSSEQNFNSNQPKKTMEGSGSEFMLGRCLNDIFSRYGLGFNLHNSAAEYVSKVGVMPQFKMTSTSTIGDFLVGLADEYGINFLLGFDRISVFSGRDLPRDIDQDMYVYFVQTRYVPVMSVMNALAAAG